ncbi:MAG: UbiA-like polyprenyltransferase [Candidatus Latescibacterota bacterium]|jgi:4-hydroxybenzoate polyprenyltransferase
MSLLDAALTYGRMVKLSHSLFALPFALASAALASERVEVTAVQVGWIALAMVGARSAAMGFNRLADRRIDAANPRTRGRELPQGRVSPAAAAIFVTLSAGLLILAAYRLNPLCFALSPVLLALLFGYSYTKRFTWASHLVLGVGLGAAPVAAWLALTGTVAEPPLLLGAAVVAWVAGFDVIYACQDHDFDRGFGLHSLPVRLGVARALQTARGLHLLALALLAILGTRVGVGPVYWAGVVAVAGLLVYEHRLVRADDLSRLDLAFFTMNGVISVVFLAFTVADLIARRGLPV